MSYQCNFVNEFTAENLSDDLTDEGAKMSPVHSSTKLVLNMENSPLRNKGSLSDKNKILLETSEHKPRKLQRKRTGEERMKSAKVITDLPRVRIASDGDAFKLSLSP